MTIGQSATQGRQQDSIASSVTPGEAREKIPWLLAFFCLLIPALPSFVVLAGPLKSNGSPARMIAVLFFGLSVLGFILVRRTATTRTLAPGIVIMLLFFLLELTIYGTGLTHVDDALIEAGKTRGLIVIVAYSGVALYVMTRIKTTRDRSILLGCLTIGLIFACVVGLLQTADVDIRYVLQPPGFIVNTDELSYAERHGIRRVFGTSAHPIEFSVLAAVAVVLSIHFARYANSRRVRRLSALACGVALLALPAAVSRSGMVALGAALLVYMWSFKVRQIAIAVVAGALAVLAYLGAFPASASALWQQTVNSESDPSILARTVDYAVVGDTFRAHPMFGLGFGSTAPSEYGFLDNEWLQQIVQGGLVGLLAFSILAVGGIFGITAALRSASTARERDQAYAVGAIFVAVLTSSVTMDLFSFAQATFIMFVSFALLWSQFGVAFTKEGDSTPTVHHCVE